MTVLITIKRLRELGLLERAIELVDGTIDLTGLDDDLQIVLTDEEAEKLGLDKGL